MMLGRLFQLPMAVTVNFTRQAFLGIAVSSYHQILLYLQFPFPSAKFGKNTVYSIPEILFWKIRNEFLIYHTWNNGISEKIWKISNVYRPKAPPTTFRGAQRAQFFWGTLYVFLLPTKNCKMTRIDHPKIELLSKYTEHVWERCFP